MATATRTSKSNWLILAKQQLDLHVHHASLYISLPSLHDYEVNCLISRFIENVNIRRRISLTLCRRLMVLCETKRNEMVLCETVLCEMVLCEMVLCETVLCETVTTQCFITPYLEYIERISYFRVKHLTSS